MPVIESMKLWGLILCAILSLGNLTTAIAQLESTSIYRINSWETFRKDLGVDCFVKNGEANCMLAIEGNSGVIMLSNRMAFGPVDSLSFEFGSDQGGLYYNHHHGIKDLHVIGEDRVFYNLSLIHI